MRDVTVDFIKGWFDRSCAINVATRSLFVRSSNEQPIRKIAVQLEALGVSNTFGRRSDQWELRIGTREALEAYKRNIGFECKDKAAKLDEILEGYRNLPSIES